jgi:crotonobetainyl-CoA:carnitine CoA-transferase CaiB-like acyl-CoA transferase
VRPVLGRADVIVEQFRPGVMEQLGLGYDDVSKLNPSVVYCSIAGYGQTGPKRYAAGHDLNYIGDAGLLSLSMGTREHPVVPPALIADVAGGAYPALLNILDSALAPGIITGGRNVAAAPVRRTSGTFASILPSPLLGEVLDDFVPRIHGATEVRGHDNGMLPSRLSPDAAFHWVVRRFKVTTVSE